MLIEFSVKNFLSFKDKVTLSMEKGKGDENQGDLIAVAHGGQGVLTDEFAGDQAVGDVVELLEDDAAEERQAELPEHGFGLPGCQIFVHIILSRHTQGLLRSNLFFTSVCPFFYSLQL